VDEERTLEEKSSGSEHRVRRSAKGEHQQQKPAEGRELWGYGGRLIGLFWLDGEVKTESAVLVAGYRCRPQKTSGGKVKIAGAGGDSGYLTWRHLGRRVKVQSLLLPFESRCRSPTEGVCSTKGPARKALGTKAMAKHQGPL